VFHTYADRLIVVSMPSIVHDLRTLGPWTLEALDRELSGRLLSPPRIADFLELEQQVEA
jgi:hypothetical protein